MNEPMKKFLFITMLLMITAVDVYAGFLSYMSPINKIIDSEGAIIRNNSLVDGAYLRVSVDDEGTMEVHFGFNGDDLVSESIPLRYATVSTKEIYTDDTEDNVSTAYIVKYGGFQLTYANMHGYQSFIIDRAGRSRIQYAGKSTKFFDNTWKVIKKKNGSEFRNAGDIDSYFHGLRMDKQFGMFNN